ncbi:hypothetical protein J1N35_024228 [Gossypium stocksii]|uniref:Uncharacterized protein n=1 Tax=Gossypium stocksii TaxID=47602 RepID=A0A9D3VLH0_9ROSI|nr:hypothetical protein J1N35_024228 [Gossypium stocksii]
MDGARQLQLGLAAAGALYAIIMEIGKLNMSTRRITSESDNLVATQLINEQIRGDGSNAILQDIWKLLQRD